MLATRSDRPCGIVLARVAATAVAVAAILAAGARAAVVIVSPGDMQGWSMETNQGATANLVNYGPPVYETANAWTAQDGTSLGTGAFYATLDGAGYSPDTPPSAWLGTDTFNGASLADVTLNRITKLEYYAYVGHIPNAGPTNPANWESWKGWQKFPRQPLSLQLTAESPDGSSRKQFWFMPWADCTQPKNVRGDNCGQNCKKWLRYDCINFNYPGPSMCGRWYSPTSPEEQFTSWSALVASYGAWKLVATSNSPWPTGFKSAGWDSSTEPAGNPTCTATGKCINFEIGARKSVPDAIFFQTGITWTNDYLLFKGCVDRFTLGIDGVEVTYDFEPGPDAEPPIVVATNNRSVYDRITYNPLFQNGRYTKVVGKCIERNAAVFKLDDGSGRIIHGFLFKNTGMLTTDGENPANVGEHWSVLGYFEKPPFEPASGPWCIWTAVSHMRKIR